VSYKSRFDSGLWKTVCDVCGREFNSNVLRQRWDGLMVDKDCWEPRQPQDYVRGVADKMVPPWTRPEQSDVFSFVCTPITSQGIADYGVADCASADIDRGNRPVCTLESNSCISYWAVAGCAVAGQPYPGMLVTLTPTS
jgi:hypothetical protein